MCAGPDIDYVAVKDGDDVYILAKERVTAVFGKDALEKGKVEILAEFKGTALLGWRYEPLCSQFIN